LNIILHAADISNPSRDTEAFMEWCKRINREFYNQGKKEIELG